MQDKRKPNPFLQQQKVLKVIYVSQVENIMGCSYLLENVFIITDTIQRYHVALIELNNLRIGKLYRNYAP